ncbi:MAG TPA: DUF177 domain-containing protein [Firmicutes bacterium]|nr:DUF177 domain-containing protein [Candidatus Fermentithermobacillaceae bacterium]
MKINVSDIIEQPGASIPFSETGSIEPLADGNEDIMLPAPFTVEGVATSTGEGVYVQANVKGTVRLTCSRCLSSFDLMVEFDCEGRFVSDPDVPMSDEEDDIESFALVGEYCVLDDMVQHELLLNIPMKPLCKPECKGFCEVCGANLNEEPCQCDAPGTQATLFGRKLLEALEERGKDNGSSKEEDLQV